MEVPQLILFESVVSEPATIWIDKKKVIDVIIGAKWNKGAKYN